MATVYIEANRVCPNASRVVSFNQENACPRPQSLPRSMNHKACLHMREGTHNVQDSLPRLHPAQESVYATLAMAEISLHDFDPQIHQITCNIGHIHPQQGCFYCFNLYGKLANYVPTDPGIQSIPISQNLRCPVFLKSPIGNVPPSTASTSYRMPSDVHNTRNMLVRLHTREFSSSWLKGNESRRGLGAISNQTSIEADGKLTVNRTRAVEDSKAIPTLPSNAITDSGMAVLPPAPSRAYTRTPSITLSMRTPQLRNLPDIDTNISPTGKVENQQPVPNDALPPTEHINTNTEPTKPPPRSLRSTATTHPVSPIKARKEARKPAWMVTATAAETSSSSRSTSPTKKKKPKMTPKRMEALEEMVQELREEFGLLRIRLQEQVGHVCDIGELSIRD